MKGSSSPIPAGLFFFQIFFRRFSTPHFFVFFLPPPPPPLDFYSFDTVVERVFFVTALVFLFVAGAFAPLFFFFAFSSPSPPLFRVSPQGWKI